MIWSFQATGDETEIFLQDDDHAIPIILVPFLSSETFDEHKARVDLVVNAPTLATAFENVMRYDRELERLRIAPNAEDYNTVIGMLAGQPYAPPNIEGR